VPATSWPSEHATVSLRAGPGYDPPRKSSDYAGDPAMKKLLVLLILVAIGVAVAKKVREV
jgi:hypothetical protein